MNTVRRFSQYKWIQSSIVIGLALLIAGLVNFLQNPGDDSVVAVGDLDVDPTPGSIAPDFTLTSVDGELVSLRQFRGKPVLVNFWATWCGPCRRAMPELLALQRKLAEEPGFQLVGVSLDRNRQEFERYVREKSLGFPQYFDGRQWNNKVALAYGVRAIPRNVLVDREGRIARVGLRGAGLERAIQELLAEERPADVPPGG